MLLMSGNGTIYWAVGNQLLFLLRVFWALFLYQSPARKDQCHLVPSPTVPWHRQALGVPGAAYLCVISEELLVACQ